MLKKFGYTNLALLAVLIAVPFMIFDFNNIGTIETIYFVGVGIVILIHLFRIGILIKTHRGA